MKSGRWFAELAQYREALVAMLLFLATAGFVLWQNSQIAVLWDLSYLLDTSWRIALGQVPYRDFPMVHAPLTFLIQAGIMRVAGRHYFLQIGYAAMVGGLGTVVAWRIILGILRERVAAALPVSLVLSMPMIVLGIYSVYPHPIYDGDCVFAVLIALLLLEKCADELAVPERVRGRWLTPVGAGVGAVVPVFFKQNIGLPFVLAVVGGILLLLATEFAGGQRKATCPGRKPVLLKILLGSGVAMAVALAALQVMVGLRNYFHWTIQFAAQRRLPGVGMVLSAYRQPSLVWMLVCAVVGIVSTCIPLRRPVWIRLIGMCLLAAPLVASLAFLVSNDNLEDRSDNLLALWPWVLILAAMIALLELRKGVTLGRLIPFLVLAAIQGTLLSQSLDGSTYAIWPLLFLSIAAALAATPTGVGRWLVPVWATISSVTFLLCGGLYAVGHERMNYIVIPDEPVTRATLPTLLGMADRGPYLTEFEELVRFVGEEIPAQDGLLILPGEDPFYFATGRAPQFPVLLFDPTTDPYSSQDLIAEAGARNIRWVIVKTHQQSTDDQMPEKERTLAMIDSKFRFYRKLTAYIIYHR